MTRPTLFLDLDDVLVLNPSFTHYHVRDHFKNGGGEGDVALWDRLVDVEARANLLLLHNEFGPAYVISSNWTTFFTKEQLVEVLSRTGLGFVVENLHAIWATPKAPGRQRVDDVYKWLQLTAPGKLPASLWLLALDDDESGWSLAESPLDVAGQVVLCEDSLGLTTGRLDTARRLLRAQAERLRN